MEENITIRAGNGVHGQSDQSKPIAMSSFDRAMIAASEMAYDPATYAGLHTEFNASGTPGWSQDTDTGYQVTVAPVAGSSDLVVAFCGTASILDAINDTGYGWLQWMRNREALMSFITTYKQSHPEAAIHFTGHSLGGALAQYAAHEYAVMVGSEFSLTTFNSLGGIHALRTRSDDVYLDAADESYCRHFYVDRDPVSRLGSGHLGGHTIRIDSAPEHGAFACHKLGLLKVFAENADASICPTPPEYTPVSWFVAESALGIGLAVSMGAERVMRLFSSCASARNPYLNPAHKAFSISVADLQSRDFAKIETKSLRPGVFHRAALFIREAVWKLQVASIPMAAGLVVAGQSGSHLSGTALVTAQTILLAGYVSMADLWTSARFTAHQTKQTNGERSMLADAAGFAVTSAGLITTAAKDFISAKINHATQTAQVQESHQPGFTS